jgi:hypothetical protein
MATRLGSLVAALALGITAAGSAPAQTIMVPIVPPALLPTVLVDGAGAGELIRLFEEGKDAAERVDPPEVSLSPAFEPQPEYR